MQHNRYVPMILSAAAVVSACSAMPQNPSLTEAHNSYNNALNNSQVIHLAMPELKAAENSLIKADYAFNANESDDAVDHLAYLARQQVAIAETTAEWKKAELAVVNAVIKRILARRLAKTAESGAAQPAVLTVRPNGDWRAAQQGAQLKALNAGKTEQGLMITLGDTLFSANKAQLEAGGICHVRRLADFLNRYPRYNVLIKGHTESTDNRSVNRELSDRRANVVRMALNDMGISDARIRMRGYADTFAVGAKRSADNAQLNRRVEIILSEDGGDNAPR